MDEKTKLTEDQFVINSILKLRVEPYKGIHTVISGMNEGYREYFGGKDPVSHVQNMEERGLIEGHFSKKGRTIYLKGEMPSRFSGKNAVRAQETISRVVGDKPQVINKKAREKVAAKMIGDVINFLSK